jgi:hypothetical protein
MPPIKQIMTFTGQDEHDALKNAMGAHWFTDQIQRRFITEYSPDKTVAIVYLDDPCLLPQEIFGIGSSPQDAIRNTLAKLVTELKPLVKDAEKLLKQAEKNLKEN